MNLKKIRISRKLTIKDLSIKSTVAPGYIADLENGRKNNPSMDILLKLSKALEVSISALIEDEEDKRR